MPQSLTQKRIDRLAATSSAPAVVRHELQLLSAAAAERRLTKSRSDVVDGYIDYARKQNWDADTLDAICKGVAEMFRHT